MSSITFNDISDFKNLIKTGAKPQQKPLWKRWNESDIARLRKDWSHQDDWLRRKWKNDKK